MQQISFSPLLPILNLSSLPQLSCQREEKSSPPLFFKVLQIDQYLDVIIYQLKVADCSGKIKEEYREFSLPPLDKETIDHIEKSLDEKFLVVGQRPGCPLNIRITKRQVFQDAKERAKQLDIDHSKLVKYHGSAFHKEISQLYKELIFSSFFLPFKEQLTEKEQAVLILTKKKSLPPNDWDYQIKPEPSNLQTCTALLDSVQNLFQTKLRTDLLNFNKVSTYLQKLKKKVDARSGYEYLKSVLKNEEKFFPSHPEFLHTLIKVDAFIKASDIHDVLEEPKFEKNIFLFCSFGDRLKHQVDIVYPV